MPPAASAAARAPSAVLELHLGELRQLFNAMDPAPFRERDLDPERGGLHRRTGRARPAPASRCGLVVHLGREPAPARRAPHAARRGPRVFPPARGGRRGAQLRQLFRVGRVSLLIGLAFLAGAIVIGEFVAGFVDKASYGGIIKESFVIGGWVALWRPLEIFLYDWWPIRAQAQLFDRLGEMDVRVLGAPPATAGSGAAP